MSKEILINEDTLTVMNQEIPVVHKVIPQMNLRFYPDNPRIYSVVRAGDGDPTEDEIYERLIEQEHVRELIQDIKKQGGLLERVLVRGGSMHVLEGNSRLAAYRFLAKNEPIKWGKMKCTVLPNDISDSLVFAILAQYHIKGKKDWAPYEQAGFLYRRHKIEKIETDVLAKDLGLGPQIVKDMIATYQFMIDHKQMELTRWSYYYEYIKSRKIKRVRTEFPHLDSLIVKKIESGEIARAVDVRDQLPLICDAPPRVVRGFVEDRATFSRSVAKARDLGGDNSDMKKLERFRSWIINPDTEKNFLRANERQLKVAISDLKKVVTRSGAVLARLEKKLRKTI
jgi:hypothetical protein